MFGVSENVSILFVCLIKGRADGSPTNTRTEVLLLLLSPANLLHSFGTWSGAGSVFSPFFFVIYIM